MSDMTSTAAINLLDNLIGMIEDNQGSDYDAALRMSIDALKTQADGDTISRKAALNSPVTMVSEGIDWIPAYHIKELPSTQPQRTGRWIPVDSYSAYGGDEEAWMAHGNPTAFYYCSECKEQNYMGEDGEPLLTAYCPDCGARMEN